MLLSAAPAVRSAFAPGWRRVGYALGISIAVGLLLAIGWKSGTASLLLRTVALGLIAVLMFGLFEQWPKRLPAGLARWVLQVAGVAVAMPLATFLIYLLSTESGAQPFWRDTDRLEGFAILAVFSLLIAPWAALAGLVRQKDALARHQALALELERSNARLHLLQAQVAPHFLFNTLANVQALVDAGSPQASAVLRSLIAYLRAAVPLLHEPATFGRELSLAEAYLQLMHMRMPDRLQFALHVHLLLALSLATAAFAQSDAQQSFEKLKTLAGTWEGPITTIPRQPEIDGQTMHVSLRVTSMGLLRRRQPPSHDGEACAGRKNDRVRLPRRGRQREVRTHAPLAVHLH